MKKKFLDYHELHENNPEWFAFLCHSFHDDETFRLFIPTDEEITRHKISSPYAWGSEDPTEPGPRVEYNKFRQTVVLLCAAINGELD